MFKKLRTPWNWSSRVKGLSGLNLWYKRNVGFIPREKEALEGSSSGQ